jgi:hypothetical protein
VSEQRDETRVHNFIEFIASGPATPTLADAFSQAEEQVKSLSADIQSMEAAKDHAFTPPPRAWITARIGKLNHLLATRSEKSALALRRLTGPITPVAAEARSRQALIQGPMQTPRPQPAGRGRRFVIALVEAPLAPKARK